MARRAARKTKGMPLGASYRTAEVLLRPMMMSMTRRDWRGVENLGQHGQGIVVAPNHISWFDPLVMAHVLHDSGRPPRFLAKQAVFEVPVVGRIIDGADQIPVTREDDPAASLAAATAALRSGEAVIVYPEGTITRDTRLWPMSGKTGALRLALAAEVPLIPVAQWGAQEVMPPYQKTLRLIPRKTMQVNVGPALPIDDLRGQPVTKELLIEGTNRLMDAITRLLEQLRGETAPPHRMDWAAERRRRAEEATNKED